MTKINVSKFIAVTAGLILLSSCANMQAMIEDQAQGEKELSIDQKLQVSIPIPDNSKYLQLDKGKKQVVAFIIGGPNKYYNYSEEQIHFIFNKVKC